jgi:2-polyprenyl-6-methoxyphenol hydroxylase-like FAD-dependent oxidoreductase
VVSSSTAAATTTATTATATANNDAGPAFRIAIIGSGLAALSAAVFLEQELRRSAPLRHGNSNGDDAQEPKDSTCDGGGDGSVESEQRQGKSKRRKRRLNAGAGAGAPRFPASAAGGWEVTIYERDGSLEARREGYGLTLKYDPLGVLRRLGVLEDVCRRDCPSRSHYALDEAGRILGYYGGAFSSLAGEDARSSGAERGDPSPSPAPPRRRRGQGQRGNLRVPRQEVRRVLLEKLRSTSVRWGHRLVRLEAVAAGEHEGDGGERDRPAVSPGSEERRRATRIRCVFENGTSAVADWVVGADGIRSTVLAELHRLLLAEPPSLPAPGGSDPRALPHQHHPNPTTIQQQKAPPLLPPRPPALHRLGVRLIVGLSALDDGGEGADGDGDGGASAASDPRLAPLLRERGFYTLGSRCGSRLFVMPYSAPAPLRPRAPRRYMWQLSFPEPDFGEGKGGENGEGDEKLPDQPREAEQEEATNGAKPKRWEEESCTTPRQILDEALERCRGWHDPVPLLLQSTPLDTVWSTSLYDRDPGELFEYWRSLKKHRLRRRPDGAAPPAPGLPVLVVGDALHAMSCFKGQGAHQALKDGQCAASHLARHLLRRGGAGRRGGPAAAAAEACHRELVQRAAPAVLDSRRAARELHRRGPRPPRSASSDNENGGGEAAPPAGAPSSSCGFAGVQDPEMLPRLLQALDAQGVRAGTTRNLDAAVGRVICELRMKEKDPAIVPRHQAELSPPRPASPDPPWTRSAAEAARRCDLARLRELSWAAKDDRWMQGPVDDEGNTCLHLAAAATGNTCLHLAAAAAAADAASDTGDIGGGTPSERRPPIGGDDFDADEAARPETLQWLVLEAGCSCRARNDRGQAPADLVPLGDDASRRLLRELDRVQRG